MHALILLPLILLSFNQGPTVSDQPAPITVVNSKWFRDRQAAEQAQSMTNAPAPAMIGANKNFELQRRNNMPPGDRDPNNDTLDGRSAAMEKSVQQSRAPKPIEGFGYRAKLQNASNKVIEVLFWEYEFTEPASASPSVARRQFICASVIKPGKEKELKGFSLSGPSDVVSVGTLTKGSDSSFQEKVVINRVEYSDGTIWQRKGWDFGAVRLSYGRAVNSPWVPDMCKAL